MGVHARDARVPGELKIAARSAAEYQSVAAQCDDLLGARAVSEEQERSAARRLEEPAQLRSGDVHPQDRPFLRTHYR